MGKIDGDTYLSFVFLKGRRLTLLEEGEDGLAYEDIVQPHVLVQRFEIADPIDEPDSVFAHTRSELRAIGRVGGEELAKVKRRDVLDEKARNDFPFLELLRVDESLNG